MSMPIRMLLIDYSIVFREMLMKRLVQEPQLQLLPSACDPFDALHKVNKYRPDVIICAHELPFLSGIDLIRKHLSLTNVPIIAMSVNEELKGAALQAGAIDFIAKPKSATYAEVQRFTAKLLTMAMQIGKSERLRRDRHPYRKAASRRSMVIAIGASTHGTAEIVQLLSNLPSNCPPVLLSHQAPYGNSRLLVEQLKANCTMGVKEAADGDNLRPGTVMVASTDEPVCLTSDDRSYYVKYCRSDEQEAHKLDCFFESVAVTMGCYAIGILMTGTDEDGVRGLHHMRRAGARAFARVENSVRRMSKLANELSAVEEFHSSDRLAKQLLQVL